MSRVVVVGGGPIGLATAMLFAKQGHEATVLEKDPQAPPASSLEAFETWERNGVAQFRHVHNLMPKFRYLLEAELPEVSDEIQALGACRFNTIESLPAQLRDPRPGDDRFDCITARRPVAESAFARVAENTPGVKIMRGVSVDGPIAKGAGDIPHVVGVKTKDGDHIFGDLVIDAMGRRSRFGDWVNGIGGRTPLEETSETGFAYYTRHYRSRDGSRPEFKGGIATILSTIMVITVPGDNNTWTIAIACMSGDKPLKAIRHNEVFDRVLRSIPIVAHWLDAEPLTDVVAMSGATDRYRRFVVDGEPVVTGLVAVGDSWACTNPTAGRGLSLGLGHATALRDVAHDLLDDPYQLAIAFDEVTEREFTPWYRNQMDRDRDRAAIVRAAIEGREPPPSVLPEPIAKMQKAFMIAAMHDPDVARAMLEVFAVYSLPHEIMARPGMIEKVLNASTGHDLPEPPSPSRAELLALLESG
ncbi:MAG: NAD(P)/FAD-dependent oxidoreductase [Actinomycetota bacterium]